MKLHHVRDFVTVAKSGSIRAAARKGKVSQPALSKSISQLEKELGAPLFERSVRGSVLNLFGERFLVRAEAAMQELTRGREEITQMRGSTGGSVTFAVSSAVALSFLTAALSRFRRRFPDAVVNIKGDDYQIMLRALRERSLDFAVGPVPSGEVIDDMMIEPLFDNVRLVACRREHPLRGSKRLRQLTSAQWLVASIVGPQDQEFSEIFQQNGLSLPQSLIRCDSSMAMLAILAESDALAFLPQQWMHSRVVGAFLETIPIAEVISAPPICLIRPSGMPLTPAASALADAIRACMP